MPIKNLRDLLIILEAINLGFVSKFDLSCLLTLVCEHHFSVPRAKYPMPIPYLYSTDAISVMKESMKKKTDGGYLYYTRPKSFYHVSEGSLKLEEIRFPEKKVSSQMPKNERILMEKWCSGNLRGLSQKTPRPRSEKDNPETLPIQAQAVSTLSIVEPVCIPEENACQNISQSHQDLPIELELPVKLPEVWPTEHEQER